jgi:hypothetical protein
MIYGPSITGARPAASRKMARERRRMVARITALSCG